MRSANLLFVSILLAFGQLLTAQPNVANRAAANGDPANRGAARPMPGRYVTPAGQTIRITNDPFGLAVSPDGQRAVTLHDGVMSVIDKTAYPSNGDKGRVVVFDLDEQETIGDISLNDSTFTDSFTSDLLLNPAKNELLVLDRGNFRLVRIDLTTRQITGSIPAGRPAFGLALSPDRTLAFVANVGLYVYPKVPGVTPKNKDTMMVQFPPYGALTREARDGVTAEGQHIPGLGDPMSDEAMSVWTVDLTTNKVVSRLKTGVQISEIMEEAEIGPAEVVGGASPNSVAVGSRFAYVSNATNDNLSIIDYRTRKIIGTVPLRIDRSDGDAAVRPPRIDHYRGLMPFGLTLSKDEKTIYVALLAFNAVAVVDGMTRFYGKVAHPPVP